MEIFKNIATVVGCVSACIGLLMTLFKPIREAVITAITKKQKDNETDKKLNQVIESIDEIKQDIGELKTSIDSLDGRVDKIEKNVLENESDRLKSELFACGNRCRRGIKVFPEEMEHIREVYRKYNDVLHQNHSGTLEFEFIVEYYNNQKFN